MNPQDLMKLAVDCCRGGLDKGQTPFGCAVAVGDRVLACCHNTVEQTTDITAHAEINALREACRAAGSILLEGAAVATTCEPCPMCMAALHWARVEKVYFGATIADAAAAGFNELTLPAAELVRLGGSQVELIPGVLAEECVRLLDDWKKNPARTVY